MLFKALNRSWIDERSLYELEARLFHMKRVFLNRNYNEERILARVEAE